MGTVQECECHDESTPVRNRLESEGNSPGSLDRRPPSQPRIQKEVVAGIASEVVVVIVAAPGLLDSIPAHTAEGKKDRQRQMDPGKMCTKISRDIE